jgi:hypothetical protein
VSVSKFPDLIWRYAA